MTTKKEKFRKYYYQVAEDVDGAITNIMGFWMMNNIKTN